MLTLWKNLWDSWNKEDAYQEKSFKIETFLLRKVWEMFWNNWDLKDLHFLAQPGNLKTLKNEGTANVNTEEMGEKAKESSEEIEARNEALVDEDENFPCEHCEKVFAKFSIKATHIKNMHIQTQSLILVNFVEKLLGQLD